MFHVEQFGLGAGECSAWNTLFRSDEHCEALSSEVFCNFVASFAMFLHGIMGFCAWAGGLRGIYACCGMFHTR